MLMMILPSEILTAPAFRYLADRNCEVHYRGCTPDYVQCFELTGIGQSSFCALVQTIGAGEETFWLSVKEIWSQAVKVAETALFGSFELQMITAGSINAEHMLNISNLSTLIINHARKLKPGEAAAVSYSGYWFRLKYLAPLDWGKITFKPNFQIFRQEREKFDMVLKKALKAFDVWLPDSMIVVQDFSQDPLFRFGEDVQTAKLAKFFSKESQKLNLLRGVFYLNDKRGDCDLLEQFSKAETD